MKRALIVHCWEGYPQYCWYPQTKRELELAGIAVTVPAFPETDKPQLARWLPQLSDAIGVPDQEVCLIGHSVGCITILRFLELVPQGTKIAGAVLVAPFTDDLGYEELKNFFQTKIDFTEIAQHCPKTICIFSDNDPFVPLKYADIFKNNLSAKIIIKSKAGHFSGAADDEGACLELPEVVSSVISLF